MKGPYDFWLCIHIGSCLQTLSLNYRFDSQEHVLRKLGCCNVLCLLSHLYIIQMLLSEQLKHNIGLAATHCGEANQRQIVNKNHFCSQNHYKQIDSKISIVKQVAPTKKLNLETSIEAQCPVNLEMSFRAAKYLPNKTTVIVCLSVHYTKALYESMLIIHSELHGGNQC